MTILTARRRPAARDTGTCLARLRGVRAGPLIALALAAATSAVSARGEEGPPPTGAPPPPDVVLPVKVGSTEGPAGSGWRYLAEGGQAFASPTQHFAEFAGVGVARDVRLGRRTRLALELFPFLVFNETEKDGRTRERVGASALGTLLSYEVESERIPWGLRLDAG